MKKGKKVILTLGILVIAAMTLSISTAFAEGSTEEKTFVEPKIVKYDNIAEYRGETNKVPNPPEGFENYMFAGWFTDEKCEKENALPKDATNIENGAYAKFVPKEILGLKAQVNAELWDENKENDKDGAIRFVTSVDSLAYARVGFFITVEGSTKENDKSSNKVYGTLRASIIGSDGTQDKEYTPQEQFHPNSKYFKAWTVTGIDAKNYGTKFTVTPYWETLDGTIVRSTSAMSAVRTVNQGRNWNYVFVDDAGNDETGAGTKESPYQTLEKALAVMHENKDFQKTSGNKDYTPAPGDTVYVKNVLTVNSPVNISETGVSKNLILTREAGEESVTIIRGTGVTGKIFEVGAGGTFAIKGSSGTAGIILEGNSETDASNARAVTVNTDAVCKMDYVTVQNFSVKDDVAGGGAIYADGGSQVTVSNCTFNANKDVNYKGGGAIFIAAGGEVTSMYSHFEENSSGMNGGAVYCKGTFIDTNSNYINNSGNKGGAVIIMKDATATLTGKDSKAQFIGNKATNATNPDGNAVFVNSGGQAKMTGYAFEENGSQDRQEIQVNGALTFGDIKGATIIQANTGSLNVAGSVTGENNVTIKPAKYEVDRQVLTKAEGAEDSVFRAACVGIKVALQDGTTEWVIDHNGKLQKPYVASVGDERYNTFTAAITAANNSESTDEIVVYLREDVTLSKQVTINANKNIKITNEPGRDITVSRSGDVLMLYISARAKLTLGTNNEAEQGRLIVDAGITNAAGEAITATKRIIDNYGLFVLGKNAVLQNANYNQWGAVMINRNEAELYGSVINNTSTAGRGGVILQNEGTLTIHEGTYSGNKATANNNGHGGVIFAQSGTVNICGGIFENNSAVGLGGALFSEIGTTVNISGGTFKDNIAKGNKDANALYIKGKANINTSTEVGAANNAQFATEGIPQTIYVWKDETNGGTLTYKGVPEGLIGGTGTITEIQQ